MRMIAFVLACLASTVHPDRLHLSGEPMQALGLPGRYQTLADVEQSRSIEQLPKSFRELAKLLLAFNSPGCSHARPMQSIRPATRVALTGPIASESAWVIPDDPVWVREGRLKTVGDAKEAFYEAYGKPLKELVTSFVSSMLSSITLAQVREGFSYSRVFALGLQSLCTIFLQEIPSETDREAVRRSLCIALDLDPDQVKLDAEALQSFAEGQTEEQLLSSEDFMQIAAQESSPAKYTYALGCGILTLMPLVGEEVSDYAIESWCEQLNMKDRPLKKDWVLYKSSINKLNEAKAMFTEMKAAGKRKEAEKLREEAELAAKEAEAAVAALKAKEEEEPKDAEAAVKAE